MALFIKCDIIVQKNLKFLRPNGKSLGFSFWYIIICKTKVFTDVNETIFLNYEAETALKVTEIINCIVKIVAKHFFYLLHFSF